MIEQYTTNESVYQWALQGVSIVILRMVMKILDDEHPFMDNNFISYITDHTYNSQQINQIEHSVLNYANVCIRTIMNR